MEQGKNGVQSELYQSFIKKRKTFRRTFILSCVLYSILLLGFFIFIICAFSHPAFRLTASTRERLWAYFLAGPCIVLAPALIRTHSAARSEYKKLLLNPALEEVFGSGLTTVLPNGRMERTTLQAAHILGVGEKYTANDLTVGTYRGHTFQICDFCKSHFKGQVFALECNRIFPQRLCILQQGFHRANLPKGSTKCIKTGDAKFDKIFSCYTIQSEYNQVLLTEKMKRTLQMMAELTDEKFMITVSGDMLYLVLQEQRDSFEPPLFRSFHLEKETQRTRAQLQNIAVLLDCMTTDAFQNK